MESGLYKISKKKLSLAVATQKIEVWCAYQERAQQETRDKLYEYGLHKNEIEQIISSLIENNFINEERFAMSYASGKFRIKKWGKIKIKAGLKIKRINDYCIHKAIQQINLNDYFATLEKIIFKKSNQLKEADKIKRKQKLFLFASSKGFESNLIAEILKDMSHE